MLQKVLILLLLLSFTRQVSAQWEVQNYKERISGWNYLENMFSVNDSTLFVWKGRLSNTDWYRTTNGGMDWELTTFIQGAYVDRFELGDSIVFALGYMPEDKNTYLYSTSNNGHTWDTAHIFNNARPINIWMLNDTAGFVLVNHNFLYTTNGAQSWDTASLPRISNFKNPFYLEMINEKTGYILGNDRKTKESVIYKTENGGMSWDTTYTTNNEELSRFNKFHFINADTGFIIPGIYNTHIYKTVDGGLSWDSSKITNKPTVMNDIQFINDSVGFLVGGTTTYLNDNQETIDSFLVAKTYDCGKTWESHDTAGLSLQAVQFLNDSVGFVVGSNYLIMKTQNGIFQNLPSDYPHHLIHKIRITSVEKNNDVKSPFKVYPNPARDHLNVELKNQGNPTRIELLNIQGKVLKAVDSDTVETQININVQNLPAGFYLLRISAQNTQETVKVVIQ